MHFADLPVISVMTRSRGKTLNTDSKEEGGDEERQPQAQDAVQQPRADAILGGWD